MKYCKYVVSFLLCLFFLNATTQERPPINVFYPEDYGAEPQNWSISQANSRFIYIANSKGLLEYNGAKWTVYDSPNQTNIRSVHVIDSLVYTGSYHDFGFWKKNNYGALKYTSISKSLKVDLLEDEEFWNIMSIDNSILFQSLDRIIIFNKVTSSYNIINSPTKISRLFKVDSSFYFQSLNNGLYKIENGNSVLVSNDVIIKNNVIVNIFTSNGVPIILTQDNGFFQLINNQLKPWISSASAVLKNISVFSSIQLKDGSFVLGTISNGLIHITQNGDVNYKINQSNGLTNNTILALYEDIDNNIWLGLDNGINCINIKSPYHIYYDYSGMIGSVYTSKVYNNMLYLGTNQGLFCKPLYSNENVEFLEGTQGQVWCLDIIDNTLFCGHNSGTFIVNNKQATKIANVQGTWQIKPISNHKDLLIQGNYNGLNILEKNNGQWQFRNKIKGFDISSRFFEFIDSNSVYLVHEYKGSFSIKIDKEFTKTVQVNQDSSMPIKLNSSLTKHYSDLLYSNNKGVFKYKRDSNKFAKDSVLSRLIDKDNFSSGVIVSDSLTNKLWSFSAQGIKYATLSSLSGENSIKSISFSEDLRKDVLHYESVTHIGNQKYLFGSTTGYIVLDLDKLGNKNHDITLNQIKVSTSQVNDTIKLVDITANPKFENNENNIQFSYSISEFSKIQKPEYQYKLEGIYNTWSDWSSSGTVLFKNLPFGDYTFSVRGRVGYQFTESTKSYTFHIQRPWYLSNLAFALYLLTLLLFTLLMHTIYKRYYRKQRERLMLRTTRELNLKELENKQQLMRFKNDKLREDIETKNRELGISTMNLIKKNEFLNTIKKELENVEGKNLNKVIKIIDKNLNNSDDWNLFQEAFNNADKDFLKKIKTLHPSLTANDLRLCAYLRLNLSSKEIAPLLNISTRSVEVKRYRLRKKMDLSHESSLTNYILEI